jgi:hypothetical protein
MNSDRDPRLERLFVRAREEVPGEDFLARVMEDIDAKRRRSRLAWLLAGALLLVVAGLLASPLATAVVLLGDVLPASLFQVQDNFLTRILAPVNSIAGVVGLSFLALFAAARKLFR